MEQAAVPAPVMSEEVEEQLEPGGRRWRVFVSTQLFLSLQSLKSLVVLFHGGFRVWVDFP